MSESSIFKQDNIITYGPISTYRRLRKAIGILGIGLPITLVGLSLIPFFKTEIQPSISHFYYTNLRDLFIGTECAVGLFLIRYRGFGNAIWWKNDNFLTNIAGVVSFGIAFIPVNPLQGMSKVDTLVPYYWELLGYLHYGFAATLFFIFSMLAIFVFTKGQNQDASIPVSIFNENNIYRFCGYSILFYITMISVSGWLNLFEYSTLLFEALSLFSFGLAWLIKGRGLGDKGKIGEKLYREKH